MEQMVRRERWRVGHARAVAKARADGASMSRHRLAVPVFRGGQGRPVEIPIGQTYEPMTWDPSQQRVIEMWAYRPRTHQAAWPAHADTVRDLVLRTDFFSRLRDRHLAGSLHQFFAWAAHHGFSTDPSSLLSGDRIDAFTQATWTSVASQATYRWNLRHVAAVVFPPAPEVLQPRRVVQPAHSDDEAARFLSACEGLIARHHHHSKVRQALYRDVRVVLALTFGAGCGGKVVHRVRQSWLHDASDGLWLQREDRTLPTPVATAWAPILRNTLTEEPDAWLVRPLTPNSRSEAVGKIFKRARMHEPALVGFDTDRAARHWTLHILKAANFDVIAAIVGLRPSALEVLAQLPSPADDDTTRALLRGWSA